MYGPVLLGILSFLIQLAIARLLPAMSMTTSINIVPNLKFMLFRIMKLNWCPEGLSKAIYTNDFLFSNVIYFFFLNIDKKNNSRGFNFPCRYHFLIRESTEFKYIKNTYNAVLFDLLLKNWLVIREPPFCL